MGFWDSDDERRRREDEERRKRDDERRRAEESRRLTLERRDKEIRERKKEEEKRLLRREREKARETRKAEERARFEDEVEGYKDAFLNQKKEFGERVTSKMSFLANAALGASTSSIEISSNPTADSLQRTFGEDFYSHVNGRGKGKLELNIKIPGVERPKVESAQSNEPQGSQGAVPKLWRPF
jgi:hypothetical protein